MPGIEDLLGKNKEKEQTQDPALAAGMGLPTDSDDGEGNPLEKMDQISKEKPKKSSGSKEIDSDVLEQMLMTGDNQDGMFSPDEEKPKDGEPDIHEEPDESVKKNLKGDVKPQGKYKEQFKNDMLKHPEDYTVSTPKGEMTVAEAIRKGYNPITRRFDKTKDQDKIKEDNLSQLNDTDQANLRQMMSPDQAQIAPADASKFGLPPSSSMIRGNGADVTSSQATPAAGQALAPQAGGLPLGDQPSGVPGLEQGAGAQPGQPDLSALLGGGM